MAISGKIYLDANIIVYIVERRSRYYEALLPVLQTAREGATRLFSSQLSLMECLVFPLRSGNQSLIADYYRLLFESDLVLQPITLEILQQAALLRAQYPSLRTPDAIHWATAQALEVDYLLTNDASLVRIVGSIGVLLEGLLDNPPETR